MNDLTLENNSLNDLQCEYLIQTETLSNSSTDLRNCQQQQSQAGDRIKAMEEQLQRSKGKVIDLEQSL